MFTLSSFARLLNLEQEGGVNGVVRQEKLLGLDRFELPPLFGQFQSTSPPSPCKTSLAIDIAEGVFHSLHVERTGEGKWGACFFSFKTRNQIAFGVVFFARFASSARFGSFFRRFVLLGSF